MREARGAEAGAPVGDDPGVVAVEVLGAGAQADGSFGEKESVRWLRSLEALEGRQAAWPQTQLVSVGDREADIYELFVWATAKPGRPALLVRAEQDRLDEVGMRLWSDDVPADI